MVNVKQNKEIYKCEICGNIVEVIHVGGGELVCCGQLMNLLQEKTHTEEGKEKHVPIIEKNEKGITVKVGSVPHPMESEHYIEWIEIIIDGISCRKFLKPNDAPEVIFENISADTIEARVYCNIHGLWKS